MEKLMISGGRPLRGTVTISGAKNSAIALIPAAILAESEVVLDNLPLLSDVAVYAEILEELGGQVSWEGNQMRIDPSDIKSIPMPNGPVKKLRASYYMMGAMLGRFKEAVIGCRAAVILNLVPSTSTLRVLKRLAQPSPMNTVRFICMLKSCEARRSIWM